MGPHLEDIKSVDPQNMDRLWRKGADPQNMDRLWRKDIDPFLSCLTMRPSKR